MHPKPSANCPSCNNLFTGPYCSHCGEKQINHHDFTIRHQAEEAFEGFTHFDNKFFKTLRTMALNPGQLTLDHFNGRRVLYMKPFQMFIVCNLLFFLFSGRSNMFAISLYSYFNYDPYISLGSHKILAGAFGPNVQFERLAGIFDERIVTQSKAFIILFIPVFTLAGLLLFVRRRRYLAEHFIFATHYFTAVILFYILLQLLVLMPGRWFLGEYNVTFDSLTSIAGILFISWYYGKAAKRFYQISNGWAITAAGINALVFVLAVYAYRMFLFLKIIHQIN